MSMAAVPTLLALALLVVDPDTRPPSGTVPRPEKARADEDSLPRDGEPSPYNQELPEVVTKVSPLYPEAARRQRIDGTVIVHALIGRDGIVKQTRVAKSIPPLDAAAEACVRQWTFKPSHDEAGKPMAVWVAVPIKFTLQGVTSPDTRLKDAVAELQRAGVRAPSPADAILRERIIRLALEINPQPEVSMLAKQRLEASRAAADSLSTPGGAARAIEALAAVLHEAPWLPEPYWLIAPALEAAGRPADAIVALELYLVADPRSPHWEEVRRRLAGLRAASASKH